MTRHVEIEELSAYLDHELAAVEAERLVTHLAGCPACAERLAGLERTVGALRRLERVVAPELVGERLRRQVAGESRAGLAERLAGGFRLPVLQPAFASVFALILGGAIFYIVIYNPERLAEPRPSATVATDSAEPPPAAPVPQPALLRNAPGGESTAAPRPVALRRRVPGGVVGGVAGAGAPAQPVEVPEAVAAVGTPSAAAQDAGAEPAAPPALRLAARAGAETSQPASPRAAAGRLFVWVDSGWREEGLTAAPAMILAADSPAALALLEQNPELRDLLVDGPIRLALDDQVVELRAAAPPPQR
jgi:hypothetical protein